MLDQVLLTGAVLASVGLQLEDGVPLVVPGEDHHFASTFLGWSPLRRLLDMDEPGQQVQPVVPLPDTLPQVRRAMPGRVWRVALVPVVSEVERQESGRLAREPSGHRDLLGVDREMDKGTTAERDVPRVPVPAVLSYSVLDGLAGDVVLQLRCGHRDAVDEKGNVERFARTVLVGELPGHGDPIALITLNQLRGEVVRGLEERDPQLYAEVHDTMTEHFQGAAVIEVLSEATNKTPLGGFGISSVTAQ
jgi:hypothetical protein